MKLLEDKIYWKKRRGVQFEVKTREQKDQINKWLS